MLFLNAEDVRDMHGSSNLPLWETALFVLPVIRLALEGSNSGWFLLPQDELPDCQGEGLKMVFQQHNLDTTEKFSQEDASDVSIYFLCSIHLGLKYMKLGHLKPPLAHSNSELIKEIEEQDYITLYVQFFSWRAMTYKTHFVKLVHFSSILLFT